MNDFNTIRFINAAFCNSDCETIEYVDDDGVHELTFDEWDGNAFDIGRDVCAVRHFTKGEADAIHRYATWRDENEDVDASEFWKTDRNQARR